MANDVPLGQGRYGVGISWETRGKQVDIDLQCVVADDQGVIIDCCYYNNMKAARGITHSGDETEGIQGKIQELVWVVFKKLAANISVLVFVIAAYKGGSLQDVQNGKIHILEEDERNQVNLLEMERSSGAVDVVAAIYRKAGSWCLRVVDTPAVAGQHFMDILPLLGEVIREFVPQAPKKQKVAFAMVKGGVLDLPQDLGCVTVGLGWDVDDGECDLDVSAVLLNKEGRDIDAVFFGKLKNEEHGITHSGDNLTGEGDGDDEQIVVNLQRVGPAIEFIVFVVNIYSQGKSFRQVASPYCRVVDDSMGSELCRYSLRDAGNQQGLIVSKLGREAGGRWGFHALGLPCQGRTWKDSLQPILDTCAMKTAGLMMRGGTADFNHPVPADPISAPPAKKSSACAIQ